MNRRLILRPVRAAWFLVALPMLWSLSEASLSIGRRCDKANSWEAYRRWAWVGWRLYYAAEFIRWTLP